MEDQDTEPLQIIAPKAFAIYWPSSPNPNDDTLDPEGIAPDYLLKLDPQQNVSVDEARLPNWDYSTGEPITRNVLGFILNGSYFLNRPYITEWIFNEEKNHIGKTEYSLATFVKPTGNWNTYYFLSGNDYAISKENYILFTTPIPPFIPNGTDVFPWINAGGITTSASYNYQYNWVGDVAQISGAPLIDTTGWARPIPAPTQVAPPNNFYNSASATGLQAKTSTYSRTIIDFGVQLPNNTAEIDINIVPGTAGLSVRVGNCVGLNSGNAIYFVADKPIPSSAVKFYGNNTYILPTFHPNGEFFFTCNHITSSSDEFVVVIDAPNIDWLSIFRSPGIVGE